MPIDFAATKAQFHLPEGVIYLDGNSLGPMVKSAPDRMEKVMRDEWAEMLIRGWNKAGWMAQPALLGDRIGKLIGAPVPGTMTAVWWETQIDPTLVFGIPQVGVKDMQGNYLENQQLQPDVEVYNTPEAQLSGEDTQLKRAVEVMLQTVK